MRRLTQGQSRALLSLRGVGNVPGNVTGVTGGPPAISTYGAPNVPRFYSDGMVLGAGGPGGGVVTRIDPVTGATITTPAAPKYKNENRSFITSFSIANNSTQILPDNPRRTLLLIQNLDATANLYFNLGSGASVFNGVRLEAGEGYVFDVACPADSLFVFFDSASNSSGIVLEVQV